MLEIVNGSIRVGGPYGWKRLYRKVRPIRTLQGPGKGRHDPEAEVEYSNNCPYGGDARQNRRYVKGMKSESTTHHRRNVDRDRNGDPSANSRRPDPYGSGRQIGRSTKVPELAPSDVSVMNAKVALCTCTHSWVPPRRLSNVRSQVTLEAADPVLKITETVPLSRLLRE